MPAKLINLGNDMIGLETVKGRVIDVTDYHMHEVESGWTPALIELFAALIDITAVDNYKFVTDEKGEITAQRRTEEEIRTDVIETSKAEVEAKVAEAVAVGEGVAKP